MAYATTKELDAGIVRGSFVERDYKNTFEFGDRNPAWRAAFAPEFDQVVYCGPYSEPRPAQVFKTTARIVTDEGANGEPIVCTWKIRKLRRY
jgi:hypothetical protein